MSPHGDKMPLVPTALVTAEAFRTLVETHGLENVVGFIVQKVKESGGNVSPDRLMQTMSNLNESQHISRSQIRRIIAEELKKIV